jgi:hypothetical protein
LDSLANEYFKDNPDEEIDLLTCISGAIADLSFNEMSIHY